MSSAHNKFNVHQNLLAESKDLMNKTDILGNFFTYAFDSGNAQVLNILYQNPSNLLNILPLSRLSNICMRLVSNKKNSLVLKKFLTNLEKSISGEKWTQFLKEHSGEILSFAVSHSAQENVLVLIDKKFEVNYCNARGWSPLTWAVAVGDMTILRLLLHTEGVNVNMQLREDAMTPLHAAYAFNRTLAIKYLKEHRADDKIKANGFGVWQGTPASFNKKAPEGKLPIQEVIVDNEHNAILCEYFLGLFRESTDPYKGKYEQFAAIATKAAGFLATRHKENTKSVVAIFEILERCSLIINIHEQYYNQLKETAIAIEEYDRFVNFCTSLYTKFLYSDWSIIQYLLDTEKLCRDKGDKIDPQSKHNLYFNLGHAYFYIDSKKAISYLKKALEYKQGDPETIAALAGIYLRLGDVSQLIELLQGNDTLYTLTQAVKRKYDEIYHSEDDSPLSVLIKTETAPDVEDIAEDSLESQQVPALSEEKEAESGSEDREEMKRAVDAIERLKDRLDEAAISLRSSYSINEFSAALANYALYVGESEALDFLNKTYAQFPHLEHNHSADIPTLYYEFLIYENNAIWPKARQILDNINSLFGEIHDDNKDDLFAKILYSFNNIRFNNAISRKDFIEARKCISYLQHDIQPINSQLVDTLEKSTKDTSVKKDDITPPLPIASDTPSEAAPLLQFPDMLEMFVLMVDGGIIPLDGLNPRLAHLYHQYNKLQQPVKQSIVSFISNVKPSWYINDMLYRFDDVTVFEIDKARKFYAAIDQKTLETLEKVQQEKAIAALSKSRLANRKEGQDGVKLFEVAEVKSIGDNHRLVTQDVWENEKKEKLFLFTKILTHKGVEKMAQNSHMEIHHVRSHPNSKAPSDLVEFTSKDSEYNALCASYESIIGDNSFSSLYFDLD